ncbi:malate:quinone oxidoreductase [Pseudomonas sp. FH4]|jgi:malate dehydrogenase (quinone)|uniref:Probable malate:quinone oxidoreductase n=1 Tax=Pseudomonas brenneri TaxID=129817 RepID=A0A5B2UUR4_9PSED|nr:MULTISPECIES: malate dehydrogenase (quinone) [Pseudomonas]KAA6176938.1 malate dehydrogenase (quinone) [Pseudomonas marginalis]MBU0937839.1 malate dehydrogenase (quinone) [Gammaproteobacteria bacterium]ETK18598.1 malate:quinone oxidoreductase [Pseudomonas sp. FH4]KAA2229645.1 malate dehydrogenase (quinone) [Pseudomonas brenneri]MBF8006434.1 malate dehydrogenase (quinone) [Pseudomonas brenneri]
MAHNEAVDVVLVGAGIMSATLAVLLKELDPGLKLEVVELMDSGAAESSNPWNNAGTGHAGLCELNYTPQAGDGSIDIKKAVHINTQFEVSKQFWAYLTKQGTFGSAKSFISPVPHLSFVQGEKGVSFLKKRFETLSQHHAFSDMHYTEDRAEMAEWMPLMMPGRPADEKIAATRVMNGTDVNFGALTNQLLAHLSSSADAQVKYSKRVTGLKRNGAGWTVSIKDVNSGNTRHVDAKFVFLGAGGAALPLLQASGIEESKGFGGFPVSGQWLRCDNPQVVKQHQAKVYSQAAVGSPPMSVPHLDTRVVEGKKSLLFGPYAGFTTKFLKFGSFLDLPMSIRLGNIGPMLAVARDNMDLTKYLVSEVMQSMEQRLESLRRFYPEAKAEDWRLEVAGQRVQIIKKDPKKGGVLQFGTELVAAKDGSLAALLGASPGASVTVSIMLELIERCFPAQAAGEWATKLQEIFPAREKVLETDAELYRKISVQNNISLELVEQSSAAQSYA